MSESGHGKGVMRTSDVSEAQKYAWLLFLCDGYFHKEQYMLTP